LTGEIDPAPETKPARPDPVDMDEDEKEVILSNALEMKFEMLICFGEHVLYAFDDMLDALRGQGSSCKHEREKG
jgi:hypothetical protein